MVAKADRREFLKETALGIAGLAGASLPASSVFGSDARRSYRGPNVILIRFGGGVRRRETIEAATTYCPYLVHELFPRGVLFPKMRIDQTLGVQTSHGEGTLHLLTGRYNAFRNVNTRLFGDRFEPQVPTLFEYLRKSHDVAESETLIINGEDRIDEEFYSFSNHHLFGVDYRSNVLSLYRFKLHLLRRQLREGAWDGKEREKKERELAKMLALDPRAAGRPSTSESLTRFWTRWERYYGRSGLVNPRGDRVLTELAVRAIRELRPKLMMVNYNDCDYVHWGFMSHYTRGIQIMDEGIRRIVDTVEGDPEYRDNTVIAVVPDCGRDSNPFVAVPCQHHFGSRSAHEIFGFFYGPGIRRGEVVDRTVDQISTAATLGELMGFRAELAEGPVLEELWG